MEIPYLFVQIVSTWFSNDSAEKGTSVISYLDTLEQVELVSESFSIFSPFITLSNIPTPDIARHLCVLEFQ